MIEVRFLNVITGSSKVLRRTFESEAHYLQWLATVRGDVEVLSVRPVVATP